MTPMNLGDIFCAITIGANLILAFDAWYEDDEDFFVYAHITFAGIGGWALTL